MKTQILFLVLSVITFSKVVSEPPTKVTNIALIGATGDLAKKYLWQGLFNLYQERGANHKFNIFGGARVETTKGEELVQKILEEKIKCENCGDAKDKFRKLVVYHQLKREKDYVKFCAMINSSSHTICPENDATDGVCYKDSNVEEFGRLFYLSIPPFAYAETAKFINKHCRPATSKTWLRVVLEKPFGSDLASAQTLARDLRLSLQEEEMYRIDHYLGKTVSMEILKFRKDNEKALGRMWDSHGIDRVDIVMSETVDVQGRALFYDEYGVIRDVMQNHLTELLLLVAMDLPSDLKNVTDIHQKKMELLQQVHVVSPQSMIIGQYGSYASHVQEDYEDKAKSTKKPTFAAALLHVSNNRWHGVNFHLISGKKLNQRASYVKVTFKSRHSCLGTSEHCPTEPDVLIFNIGHGDIGTSAIAMTKSLSKVKTAWSEIRLENKLIFGRKSEDFSVFVPRKDVDAYSSLIRGVFHGERGWFVSTEGLMMSWEKWTPAVLYLDDVQPKIYNGGKDITELNFKMNGSKLEFLKSNKDHISELPNGLFKFRGSALQIGETLPLIEKLSHDILQSALDAISARGVFHLALSGGTSAPKIFQALISLRHEFPWQQTHIWVVDERCVSFEDEQSNFRKIQDKLLNFIKIPYNNVHPMPIELSKGICNDEDAGAKIYAASIKLLVRDSKLDFVVLGVGGDGHTASLFPDAKSLEESKKYVIYSDGGPHDISSRRMTLTLPVINKSRSIAVLVTGKSKAGIVGILKGGTTDVQSYPIVGVAPDSGALTWYIDVEAYVKS